ncbi:MULTISPECIES: (Fe-S)-binding protein [Paracoccus]|uniref:(Fe-S)-binding protein n=1 Tax=Paracoccus TaxID=265 RepID=UPI002585C5D5|nr:hypothetical protein [Paracoccus sp. (in: a-proteobacteria)]
MSIHAAISYLTLRGEAAERVLIAAGYPFAPDPARWRQSPNVLRPDYLASGQTESARAEAKRSLDALRPFVERGARVVGLEPSCIISFRDEMTVLPPAADTEFTQGNTLIFNEFLAANLKEGKVHLPLADQGGKIAHLHGHCHQKAFAAMGPVETVLRSVPGLELKVIESSCCGMSGTFGYAAENIEVSRKMAELSLLPAVRKAQADDLIVADGTSCRHQIHDGAGREDVHVARVLDQALHKS